MRRCIGSKYRSILLGKTQNLYETTPSERTSSQGGPFIQAGPPNTEGAGYF